jgi:hypothetical protein
MSLTDLSLQNRRAEILLGVLPEAPFGLATAAMLMQFHFFFKLMKFNKLYSLIFSDNLHSLRGTLHLGFRHEGLQRQHTRDPATGKYVDVVQTGLLAEDAFDRKNLLLMDKLLRMR